MIKNIIKKIPYALPVTIVFIGIFFCFFSRRAFVPKESFEAFKISSESLIRLIELSNLCGIDYSETVSLYMLENNFFEEKKEHREEEITDFLKNYKNIKAKYTEKELSPYRDIIKNIFSDLEVFPIDKSLATEYCYGDSYGAPRTYGGKRIHKGTDIFDSENIDGRLQILSMTDGTVENLGWNEKGGFRVGIRSENGVYYYYAHLAGYAEGLKKGGKVKAGDPIGYMGSTGYSKTEGAKGNFPVHLHIGISPKTALYRGEVWLNPYPFLKCLEEGAL